MDEKQMKMAEELLFSGEKKPSFAKGLYFGQFDSSKVFPYPQVDKKELDKVEKFCKNLESYMDEHLDPGAIDRKGEIPDSLIKGLGELGLLGMSIPTEHGGQGFSQYGYCKAMELVASRCGSTALLVNAHQSVALKAILLYGTDEQRKKFLPKLSNGEQLAAFSLTEPNAGSDAAGVQTKAVFDSEKNVYRISGRKQWSTSGSIASVIILMAQTDVETPQGIQERITAFILTPDMKGVSVRDAALEKVGLCGSQTTNLDFDNVEVPAENVLGKKGRGLNIALDALNYGRTTFGATCTGSAKKSLELAIEHAKNRHQFKRSLATFPMVKEKISRMSALVYAMDATTHMTAGLIDNGQSDVMIESAILKVFASEAQWEVIYESMQILGGRSLFKDRPFERMMRDSRFNSIGEGSNDVLRVFIGVVGMRDVGTSLQAGMEALKNPFVNFRALCKFSSEMLNKLRRPSVHLKSKIISDEATRLSRAVKKVGMMVPKLLSKHREGVIEKQLLLNRIADVMIALYTSTAVLSKLDSDLQRVGGVAEQLGGDVSVGKLYCSYAIAKIEQALADLDNHNDDEIEKTAEQLTGVPPFK